MDEDEKGWEAKEGGGLVLVGGLIPRCKLWNVAVCNDSTIISSCVIISPRVVMTCTLDLYSISLRSKKSKKKGKDLPKKVLLSPSFFVTLRNILLIKIFESTS